MGNKESSLQIVGLISNNVARDFFEQVIQITNFPTPLSKRFSIFGKMRKPKKENRILQLILYWINSNHQKDEKTFTITLREARVESYMIHSFAKILQTNTSITSLLFHSCIFDGGVLDELTEALKLSQSIEKFGITHNRLNTPEYYNLIEGISENNKISHLYLTNTYPSDEIMAMLIIKILSVRKNYQVVDLSENNLSEFAFQYLLKSIDRNPYLYDIRLRDNSVVDNEKIKQFGKLLQRNEVVVFAVSQIIDNAFKIFTSKKRANQTMFSRSTPTKRSIHNNNNNNDNQIVMRGRGGTVNSLIQNSNPIIEMIEDYGNTPSHRYQYGHSCTIGRRNDMQDAVILIGGFGDEKNKDLFCVFDGHGTSQSAIYSAKNLPSVLSSYLKKFPDDVPLCLRNTFKEVDRQLSIAKDNGTTAVVALIINDTLYVANVGDSRAVLCRNRKAIALTVDHRPNLQGEAERITESGGYILSNRVNGCLAVTRALGDHFVGACVIADPYVTKIELCTHDQFLVIACDGLFDVFSNEEVVKMISTISDPQKASEKLKNEALLAGSSDNISVVVVHFGFTHSHIQNPSNVDIIYGLYDKNKNMNENNEKKIENENIIMN